MAITAGFKVERPGITVLINRPSHEFLDIVPNLLGVLIYLRTLKLKLLHSLNTNLVS